MKEDRCPSKQGTSSDQETGERRKLLTGLAGALGVLALAGCARESPESEEELGEAASELSGTNVGWVDTTYGDNGNGDLKLHPPAQLGGAVAIIARGSKRAGDGGGGLFYWDATSTATEDVGLVIAPDPEAAGRWIRVRPDWRINARWFGAQGNGQDDDSRPIQRAIDACCRSLIDGGDYGGPGGVVHLPAGDYRLTNPIALPRNRLYSFTLAGDGPLATMLSSEVVGQGAAVLVPTVTNAPSWWLEIRDMFIRRVHGGTVLEHPSADDQKERLEHLRIRNVIFQNLVTVNGVTAPGPGTTVRLVAAFASRLEDVEVRGGETLLSLESSARCAIVGFSTGLDDTQVNGIKIVGGGQHILQGVRIEGCAHGDALSLHGCSGIDVTTLTVEGKDTARVVAITGGTSDVTLRGCVIGTGRINSYSGGEGVHVDGSSRNVRIEGGEMRDCTLVGGKALRVMGGARDVRVTGWSHAGGAAQAAANVDLAIDAIDCRVEILAAYGDRVELTAGVLGTPTVEGGVLALGPFETLLLGGPPVAIQNIVQGSMGNQHSTAAPRAGRRVTLIFNAAGYQVVGNGYIVLAGCASYSPPIGAVLSLLHDGARWREVSRAETGC